METEGFITLNDCTEHWACDLYGEGQGDHFKVRRSLHPAPTIW